MLGLMQDWPLLCHRIIEHAARVHGHQEVITRSVEGPIHRTNYRDIHRRALKVSQALDCAGIELGDRIATIAWNTWRHLECWYGIMGIGAICQTVNPRLFPENIAWIVKSRSGSHRHHRHYLRRGARADRSQIAKRRALCRSDR